MFVPFDKFGAFTVMQAILKEKIKSETPFIYSFYDDIVQTLELSPHTVISLL